MFYDRGFSVVLTTIMPATTVARSRSFAAPPNFPLPSPSPSLRATFAPTFALSHMALAGHSPAPQPAPAVARYYSRGLAPPTPAYPTTVLSNASRVIQRVPNVHASPLLLLTPNYRAAVHSPLFTPAGTTTIPPSEVRRDRQAHSGTGNPFPPT